MDVENGVPRQRLSARQGLEQEMKEAIKRPWDRFRRKGEPNVGVLRSIKNIVTCSWLNLLLILTPIAWWAHFEHEKMHYSVVFALCFIAIIPHEKLFDYYGEQMKLYLGKDIGDLLTITLNKYVVEATLAIILMTKCKYGDVFRFLANGPTYNYRSLKLLQSTIVGVVVLHLLLIPGAAFFTGGARIWEQDLHPAHAQLNHSLLTVGVLSLLLPAAFYAALEGTSVPATGDSGTTGTPTVDSFNAQFLPMSRGIAVILLLVYVGSRIYYHNPPGEGHNMTNHPAAPEELRHEERKLANTEPEVNQWVCLVFLVINVGLMAATAEWLVDSIEPVSANTAITEEWFGIILLPIVSFSADGAIAIGYFIHRTVSHVLRREQPSPPATLAKAEAIDLSIQFLLFWTPVVTLLAWWTDKPLSLLFDFFEIALLIASCFLVNYVTQDAKTNWIEGYALLSFYAVIALCTWYYTGESSVKELLLCPGQSVEAE
ncbi:hypothetical protein ID866_1187 [Astraeus odoratus]|nr:hypothetical protein ID866_1187 [Astraeus odoratus]